MTALDNRPVANRRQRDLSLPEAIDALLARRRFLLSVTLIAGLLGVVLAFSSRKIYEGSTLISVNGRGSGQLQQLAQQFSGIASLAGVNIPGSADNERSAAVATLASYELYSAFVDDPKVRGMLEPEARWFRWLPAFLTGNVRLTTWKAVELLRKHVSVEEDTVSGLVTLSVEWYDPLTAATWANRLTKAADDKLRARTQRDSRERISRLTHDYETSTLVVTRDAISGVLANELRTLALSQADENFTYQIIDQAVPAEKPVRPHIALIISLFSAVGLLVAGGIILVGAQRRST